MKLHLLYACTVKPFDRLKMNSVVMCTVLRYVLQYLQTFSFGIKITFITAQANLTPGK